MLPTRVPKPRKVKSNNHLIVSQSPTTSSRTTATRTTTLLPPPISIPPTTTKTSPPFLLPFTEIPTSSLLSSTTSKTTTRIFSTCMFHRTSKEDLANSTSESEKCMEFQLEINQFVFLRPLSNEDRAGVARIVSFHTKVSPLRNQVKVQWFYRGEDLGSNITVAGGEDEVFESDHFDTVDIDTLCGRCYVLSYPQWLNVMSNQIEKNEDEEDGEDVNFDDEEVVIGLENTDDEDNKSYSKDNYSECSIYLYCRKFYDLHTQQFVTSKFEHPQANPLEQLALLQSNQHNINDTEQDNDFFVPPTSPSHSDSDPDLDPESDSENQSSIDPIDKYTPPSTKRRRKCTNTTTRTPGTIKRQRRVGNGGGGGGGMQFVLPSSLGEELPCRDDQKEHVRNFLLSVINDPDGLDETVSRSLYISGVPGTGKTATVRQVASELRIKRSKGELNNSFTILEINAMSMGDGSSIYTELYNTVTGQQQHNKSNRKNGKNGRRNISAPHAAQLLEKRYMNENSNKNNAKRGKGEIEEGIVIIILDEMDVLLNKKQKVLYDLLEWPSRKLSRLAIIGIANTMDLPERMLPRVGSRLGLNRLVYPPYTRDQIITILKHTLPKNHEFNYDALRLCASKIGGVSGDIRRALELCRRAQEVSNDGGEITAGCMQKAIHEVAGQFRLVALKQLSVIERLALVVAVKIARVGGVLGMGLGEGCSIEKVCEVAWDVVVREEGSGKAEGNKAMMGLNSKIVKAHDVEEACWRLAGMRMVIIEKAIVRRLCHIVINVPIDDCVYALKDCPMCARVLSES